MSLETRRLRVEFSTEAAFRSEYLSNIANGGVFISSLEPMEVREAVRVELSLAWCNRTIELDGEVVHCIPPEMADAGGSPGAAIQFALPARELRARFEPLVGTVERNERVTRSGRRAAARSPARVRALIRSREQGEFEARTRDISSSGMLVSVAGTVIPVGDPIVIELSHPRSGERMAVDGTVVRHLATEAGEVMALGIEFHIHEARQTEISSFINDVRAAEHSRRLGGISGPIAQLGIENLLQMFGSSSPQGTLTLTRGAEEGEIVFASGMLRGAWLGEFEGREALKHMLAWRQGSFEFQTRVEDEGLLESGTQEELSLNAAILDAFCELDEDGRDADLPAPLAALAQGSDDPLADLDLDLEDPLEPEIELDFEIDGGVDEAKVPKASPAARASEDDPAAKAKQRAKAAQVSITAKPVQRTPGAKAAKPRAAVPIRILPETVFVVDMARADPERAELDKIEEAVLDLAGVGMPVARMVEVIPEPELEVYAALDALLERGLIRSR